MSRGRTGGERQKQSEKIGGIGGDRLASLEIQLLQQGPRDNAQRTTRAMPPRESWLGERDENNSGRRILRHFAMRRDEWKEKSDHAMYD